MICLRRHFPQLLQGSGRVKHKPAVFLVADPFDPPKRRAVLQMPDDLEQSVLPLTSYYNVNILGRQGLVRQERGMPPSKDDRKIGIKTLCLTGDLHRFTNHRARDQGHGKAHRVPKLLENSLLKPGSDRRINDADLISGAQKRRRNGEDSQGRRCFQAGERGEEKDYLLRTHRCHRANINPPSERCKRKSTI